LIFSVAAMVGFDLLVELWFVGLRDCARAGRDEQQCSKQIPK
jgi:hypothetical protein